LPSGTSTPEVEVDSSGRQIRKLPNKRFERIKADNVTYHHDGLRDNSFEARERAGADPNDYGARASRDLIVTRGAGFRKEKNKKKRGVSATRRDAVSISISARHACPPRLRKLGGEHGTAEDFSS
jgi:hypothetical protein